MLYILSDYVNLTCLQVVTLLGDKNNRISSFLEYEYNVSIRVLAGNKWHTQWIGLKNLKRNYYERYEHGEGARKGWRSTQELTTAGSCYHHRPEEAREVSSVTRDLRS